MSTRRISIPHAGFNSVDDINAAPVDAVANIVKYHVLATSVFAGDLTNGATPTTIQGGTLTIGLTPSANVKVTGSAADAAAITAATKNRPDNVTTAAFFFQTVNGYVFNPHLFTGIGVAADLYATQTTIPVFASVRGNLAKHERFIPFYFLDGGYGIDITSSTTSISYEGGLMGAAGLGFKIPLSNGAGFLVSFGYRMQKGATTDSGVKNKYTNNRIALRAGFYL